jgi:hypothetical protein
MTRHKKAWRGDKVKHEGVPSSSTCVCGKVAFASKAQAKIGWKRSQFGDSVSTYRCPQNPESWHNGHLRPEVRRGEVSRDVMGRKGAGVRDSLVFCCGFDVAGKVHRDGSISWRCGACNAVVRLSEADANAVLLDLCSAGMRPSIALLVARRSK